MNFISNEFFAPKTLGKPQCKCGAQPRVFRKMMDPRTGIRFVCLNANVASAIGPRPKSKAAGAAAQHLRRPL